MSPAMGFGDMMRACNTCGEEKPLTAFYKHPFGKDGRANKCAECTKLAVKANRRARIEYYQAYERERAKLPHRVEARTEYAKRVRPSHPEKDPLKKAARTKLGNAVRDGKIIKPPHCEVCSAPDEPVHGHHDDYTKPLDVIWVCQSCHALIHAYWRAQDRIAA